MKMELPKKENDHILEIPGIENIRNPNSVRNSKFALKSDREIWRDFKNGNEEAFNYIYRTATPKIFNYTYQHIKNKEVIKDCIQNLYIEIRNNRKKLPDVHSINAYLYKAIYWKVKRKMEAERKLVSKADLPENSFEIELSFEDKIIDKEIDKETKEYVQNLLDKLKPRQRQALLLFYKEDLPYNEVAEIMGLKNSKSARKLIYRALFSARKEAFSLKDLFNSLLFVLLYEAIKSINL